MQMVMDMIILIGSILHARLIPRNILIEPAMETKFMKYEAIEEAVMTLVMTRK